MYTLNITKFKIRSILSSTILRELLEVSDPAERLNDITIDGNDVKLTTITDGMVTTIELQISDDMTTVVTRFLKYCEAFYVALNDQYSTEALKTLFKESYMPVMYDVLEAAPSYVEDDLDENNFVQAYHLYDATHYETDGVRCSETVFQHRVLESGPCLGKNADELMHTYYPILIVGNKMVFNARFPYEHNVLNTYIKPISTGAINFTSNGFISLTRKGNSAIAEIDGKKVTYDIAGINPYGV